MEALCRKTARTLPFAILETKGEKYEKGIEKIFKNGVYITYGVDSSFSNVQKEPVNVEFKNHTIILTYSKNWFEENLEYPILLIYNFT